MWYLKCSTSTNIITNNKNELLLPTNYADFNKIINKQHIIKTNLIATKVFSILGLIFSLLFIVVLLFFSTLFSNQPILHIKNTIYNNFIKIENKYLINIFGFTSILFLPGILLFFSVWWYISIWSFDSIVQNKKLLTSGFMLTNISLYLTCIFFNEFNVLFAKYKTEHLINEQTYKNIKIGNIYIGKNFKLLLSKTKQKDFKELISFYEKCIICFKLILFLNMICLMIYSILFINNIISQVTFSKKLFS